MDDHADGELSQHEKLVALTAKCEYTLLMHLQRGEDYGSSLRQTTMGSWAEIGGAPL
jgi:hypothetical protein